MIKLLLDLLELLRSAAPLLTLLAIFTLLSVLLAKSIKKHAPIYYLILGIPFLLVTIPIIGRWFGVELFSFNRVPVLGGILRDYIHMGTFGHPLLIIIMYMGALNAKTPAVKKLMSIRKELSIISGFPILTHSLVRVSHNFPNALKFFTDNDEYMANANVTSKLGAGISNFSFVLGVAMLAVFLLLWITSFNPVHRRIGNIKWKKVQKWSYVLYAMLFIHAMGIQVGGMLNQRSGNAPRPATETVVAVAGQQDRNSGNIMPTGGRQAQNDRVPERASQIAGDGSGSERVSAGQNGSGSNEQSVKPSTGGRTPVKGISDIKVNSQTKRYIHIVSLLLIYGSYLYLRLRKARNKRRLSGMTE